ncbi:TPA: hypothetical protein N3C93_004613 [Salmonella enterica subsp. enterica serovar Agbeni]|nr:hypothetical protein [Salmonella enterica subsp. enterica serovar Agbeni]HCM2254813.1 hypothetical protein [Salmonella enterica subsp. enterica serovar Agbeni]
MIAHVAGCYASSSGRERLSGKSRAKKSVFTAAPGYIPSDAVYAVSPDYNHDEIQKLEEQIATLESLGLWRRAQTLLTRLSSMQNTAAGVTAIAHRRNATVRVINATRSRPHSAW